MILQEAECVLCENLEELRVAAEILQNDGYKMYTSSFGEIIKNVTPSHYGWRWVVGCEFPHCIAAMSSKMADDVKKRGTVSDAAGVNPHTWISFQEFVERCQPVDVGDLI